MACPLFEFRLYVLTARMISENRADVLPELGIQAVAKNEARETNRRTYCHTFTCLTHAEARRRYLKHRLNLCKFSIINLS